MKTVIDVLAQAPTVILPRPTWRLWMDIALELAVAALIGVVLHLVLSRVVRRLLARRSWGFVDVLFEQLRAPARIAWPLLFMTLARARTRAIGVTLPALDHVLLLALFAALTWLVARFIGAVDLYVKKRHDVKAPDNREARRIHTQVTVLSRSLQVVVVIAGIAAALMTFPRVQQVGASILASAGIAGIVVGFAARPVLENLIGGLQIGFTQPIRLDDVVLVAGEYGRVEEITTTYVVVLLWDERRLIVPFNKFISEPFQNWTRTGSELLGTVFVWVDYTAPVERIRAAAEAIVKQSPLWDGRVFKVQVTELTEQTMQLRVLVSANHAAAAFDLRVHVRERLIEFLQRELPHVLPRRRMEIEGASDSPAHSPPSAER
ncbi:MAG TPA: mechanosensitive ion channel domain-containing protein [Tepidisphaeraceae bacterium]|nr:mechanosensitive ion channel domain-containing protein [Tepidisphaeraceae bacterium]